MLPHRPPFLFIDEGLARGADHATCAGTFDPASVIFDGHFPQNPVVPGVLLLEGLAQTLAWWAHLEHPVEQVLLSGADKVRFRQLVRPGERLRYVIEVERLMMGEARARGTVLRGSERVVTAVVKGFLQLRE